MVKFATLFPIWLGSVGFSIMSPIWLKCSASNRVFYFNVLNIAKHKTISNIAIAVAKIAKIPFPIWLSL